MKIELGDPILVNCKPKSSKIKIAIEFLRLCIYILSRKLWKAQMILLILLGIASTFSLIALLYFDSAENSTTDYENLVIKKAEKMSHSFVFHQKQTKKTPIYYDDDGLRTSWMFQISKTYENSSLRVWSEPPFTINRIRPVNYYGENGTAFIAPEDKIQLMEQLQKRHNYNFFASQMISMHRSLPDLRFPECKELSYPKELPTTSVVIIFHNEAWPTLLRTIWSIVDRAPHELIQEIIIVDDLSTDEKLKQPLDNYVKMFPVHVEIIRTKKREGLIRSRLIGARKATV